MVGGSIYTTMLEYAVYSICTVLRWRRLLVRFGCGGTLGERVKSGYGGSTRTNFPPITPMDSPQYVEP